MPGRAPLVCVCRSTSRSRSSSSIRCAAARSRQPGQVDERRRHRLVALGPRVARRRHRVEVRRRSARGRGALERLPHHLAHDVVAQVRRQVADADAPGLPRRAGRHAAGRRPGEPTRRRCARSGGSPRVRCRRRAAGRGVPRARRRARFSSRRAELLLPQARRGSDRAVQDPPSSWHTSSACTASSNDFGQAASKRAEAAPRARRAGRRPRSTSPRFFHAASRAARARARAGRRCAADPRCPRCWNSTPRLKSASTSAGIERDRALVAARGLLEVAGELRATPRL